jgi:predicted TIM-barrel fold metal-dependent hydrolase
VLRHLSQPVQRRKILQAAAGLTFGVASNAIRSFAATGPAPARGVIDCQSHLYCSEHLALMEKRTADPLVYHKDGARFVKMGDWHRKVLPNHSDVEAKLADMDAAGIALTALSINDPGPEWFGNDGPAVARMLNDYVADIVRRWPARFFGLCVLPLQDEKASQVELQRCVSTLGMKGILLYTNLAGRFPDEPQFGWLFERAVELDLPVLLHPPLPVTASQVKGYEMISSLGNMFDDTIALTRLIMSGILDRLPHLNLVCPHLGGTLPFIIGRLDHQVAVLKRGPKYLTKTPSQYLRQVYLDIVSPLPEAMRLVYDLVGPDRLLFASDHPWVDPRTILGCLKKLGLPQAEENKILHESARELFGIR